MLKKNAKYTVLISLFLLAAGLNCNNNITNIPAAKKGYLDLSSWDLKGQGPVKLDGEWKFFWKKLLPPNDSAEPDNYINNTDKMWVL